MHDPHQELNMDLPGTLPESGLHDRTGFYSVPELEFMGFKRVGKNTQISRKCSFYKISGFIGDNVRIDDFCILKGHIEIGSYVHLCAYCMVSGAAAPVTIGDFVILAARCSVYSGSNDHGADFLGGPLVPAEYVKECVGPVKVGLGTLVGAHCVILPNVDIGAGASIGSGCVVSFNVPDGGIVRLASNTITLKENRRDYNRIKQLAAMVMKNHHGQV